MEVNFKANLVNKTYVRKYNSATKKYVPEPVSFVEFSLENKNDKKCLKKLTRKWKSPNFANLIYDKFKNRPTYRTFALTTQNDSFEKLDESKILGLEQISTENGVFLEYLQTNPNTKHPLENREYKKVGSRMLHCLKREFYHNRIGVNSLWGTIDFYLENDFDFDGEEIGEMAWRRPKRR